MENSNEILYHYCGTNSFHSIIQSRSIWLSSLSLSNDTKEGKLVTEIIETLARRDKLSGDYIRHIQRAVGYYENLIDGFGFCLSEDGDNLGQWRGYADDASGIAIGFNQRYLELLGFKTFHEAMQEDRGTSLFSLNTVKYKPEEHETLVKPIYLEAKKLLEEYYSKPQGLEGLLALMDTNQLLTIDESLREAAGGVITGLFQLKSLSFKDEREWRLISYYLKGIDSAGCLHRLGKNSIVPYRVFPLEDIGLNPISEIIIGPKHLTPTEVIVDFLRQNKFGDVPVNKSAVTYR